MTPTFYEVFIILELALLDLLVWMAYRAIKAPGAVNLHPGTPVLPEPAQPIPAPVAPVSAVAPPAPTTTSVHPSPVVRTYVLRDGAWVEAGWVERDSTAWQHHFDTPGKAIHQDGEMVLGVQDV